MGIVGCNDFAVGAGALRPLADDTTWSTHGTPAPRARVATIDGESQNGTYDERRELGGLARVTACRVGAACRHGVRLGSFVRTNGAPHSGHTPALGNDVMSYEHLVHIPC